MISYDPRAANRSMRAAMLNNAAKAALAANETTFNRAATVGAWAFFGLSFSFLVLSLVIAL